MSEPRLYRDKSIASLTGSDQAALGLNADRQFLFIQNTGNANAAVNMSGPATGGTGPGGVGNAASIGGTGCITLAAGEWILLDRIPPQNPVNVIGTAAQHITIIEA